MTAPKSEAQLSIDCPLVILSHNVCIHLDSPLVAC